MLSFINTIFLNLGIQLFLEDNTSLEKCKDYKSAKSSFENLFYFLIYEKQTWLKSCPIPCTQTTHQLIISKFHKNSILDQEWVKTLNDKAFAFYFNYDSFTIERNMETLRYDLVDFLTQAGGNLGLFIGCSCFSILISGIELFRSLNFKIFWAFMDNFFTKIVTFAQNILNYFWNKFFSK